MNKDYLLLFLVLRINFGGLIGAPLFQLEADLLDYKVTKDPALGHLEGSNPRDIFIKTGYARYYDSKISKYDWLKAMCSAMGWMFYYWGGTFYIKNRASQNIPEVILDFNKFMKFDVAKEAEVASYKSILISDGELFGANFTGGGQNARGARFNVITDYPNTKNQTWWSRVVPTGGFFNGVSLEIDVGYKYQIHREETNSSFRYVIRTYITPVFPFFESFREEYISIPKNELVKVDGGDSGSAWNLYSTIDRHMDVWNEGSSIEIANGEIRFKGNAGEMLFKGDNNAITQTYQDYVKTELFENNFNKFFNNKKATRINIEYDDFLLSPLVFYSFENYPDTYNISGNWALLGFSLDFIEQTTKLQLQRLV